jgi:hypothetical protein
VGSTAFFAHSADLLSRMAQVLGRTEEAEKYRTLFAGIRQAFAKAYVSPGGIIGGTAPGQPVLREVTDAVRSKVKSGTLSLLVKNEELGGDPVPNRTKTLHLTVRRGNQSEEQTFAENSRVEIGGEASQPLEIISAFYGYDATELGDTQGSYALALRFGLLDEPGRSLAAKRLNELVVKNGFHPTTGFWSSIELLLALTDSGYHETAAKMLTLRDEPSWGRMAAQNTTMWEAFNAPAQNLSLNHWTHSAVSGWLWRNVAGLNPEEQHPGYQSFTIRPRATKDVSWCKASFDSIRGQIVSDWKLDGNLFTLRVTVPANTSATIYVPAKDLSSIREGGQPLAGTAGIKSVKMEANCAVIEVGSGDYCFTSKKI